MPGAQVRLRVWKKLEGQGMLCWGGGLWTASWDKVDTKAKQSQGDKARAALGFCEDWPYWSAEVSLGSMEWGRLAGAPEPWFCMPCFGERVAESKGFLGFGLYRSTTLLHLSDNAPCQAGVLFLILSYSSYSMWERRSLARKGRDFCSQICKSVTSQKGTVTNPVPISHKADSVRCCPLKARQGTRSFSVYHLYQTANVITEL